VDDRLDHGQFDFELSKSEHAVGRRANPFCKISTSRRDSIHGFPERSGRIMLQPLCGYLLDVLELKSALRLLVIAWSLIAMLHGAAHSWRALAALRGLLGLTEGSANPAG